MGNETIKIDENLFDMAFKRDEDYHDLGSIWYLDKETGDVLCTYTEDIDAVDPDENKKVKEIVASNENIFLEISGFAHGEIHDILREFLDFDWTDNKELKQKVKDCYINSIGGWLDEMERREDIDKDTVYSAWQEYQEEFKEKEKEKFLTENGIKFEWV